MASCGMSVVGFRAAKECWHAHVSIHLASFVCKITWITQRRQKWDGKIAGEKGKQVGTLARHVQRASRRETGKVFGYESAARVGVSGCFASLVTRLAAACLSGDRNRAEGKDGACRQERLGGNHSACSNISILKMFIYHHCLYAYY